AQYYADYQDEARRLDRAIDDVEAVVDADAGAQASAAQRDTRIYGGLAVFAMLLTLLLIWFVSRAIVGPVRRLTAAAREMSQRQLELLDELERNEHDPAALDALFKLDHMATRMRRNAESLLVLSGAEQPRQWQQPIALLDVVRAAAAEIADFPRVELVGIDDG